MHGSAIRILTVAAERQGGWVEVRVADSGPGLPPPVRSHLFQPFVTTKPEGLGVGLSICRTIVEGHGGVLTADDNPAIGAVFRFTVPAADGP
jgi:two-component system sensor kinase FixL